MYDPLDMDEYHSVVHKLLFGCISRCIILQCSAADQIYITRMKLRFVNSRVLGTFHVPNKNVINIVGSKYVMGVG